jgi:hypothetical protein
MGGAFSRGGSWEVARPTATAQLKMEDVCILCNVIEKKFTEKSNKDKRRSAFCSFEVPHGIGTIV